MKTLTDFRPTKTYQVFKFHLVNEKRFLCFLIEIMSIIFKFHLVNEKRVGVLWG